MQMSTQKMISTEKNFLVERNVLGNLPFEFFHPATNLPSVKIFRFQTCICSVSIFGVKKKHWEVTKGVMSAHFSV